MRNENAPQERGSRSYPYHNCFNEACRADDYGYRLARQAMKRGIPRPSQKTIESMNQYARQRAAGEWFYRYAKGHEIGGAF